MSQAVEVVYHVVTPGDPDENARCCLNGVRLDVEDEAVGGGGGTGADEGGMTVAGVGCTIVPV
jgi:hypothetical protein